MQIFKWRSATHYEGRIGCAIKRPSFNILFQHCSWSSAERYEDLAGRKANHPVNFRRSNQLLPEVKGINPPKMDATTLKTRNTNDVSFLRTSKQHTSELNKEEFCKQKTTQFKWEMVYFDKTNLTVRHMIQMIQWPYGIPYRPWDG